MNNININVLGYEKQEPYSVYRSKEKFNDMLNLLLITKGKEQHYVLIKDFNKFLYNQTKHEHKKHFCMYCLQCFSSEMVLNNHKENYITFNGAQAIKMPKSYKMVYFKNYGINHKSFTESYQNHKDCGYGYKIDDKCSKPIQVSKGENAVYKFTENVRRSQLVQK